MNFGMQAPATLNELWRGSAKRFADLPALGFIDQPPLTYRDINHRILAYQSWFFSLGLLKGDKVALYAGNSPAWGAAYLAITTAGLVVVPVLADFHPREVQTILTEGDVKLALIGRSLEASLTAWCRETPFTVPVRFQIIEDLEDLLKDRIPRAEEIEYTPPEPDDLAALIYTSGTTGSSKGVMLSHKNIASNVVAGAKIPPMNTQDEFLSVLPMAHTYECSLGFLLPLYAGCRVHYLDKPASPTILLNALGKVRPHLMLTVPLLIEKIYRAKIKPALTEGLVGILSKLPFLGTLIRRKAGEKLMTSFGGRIKFFGIGGAPLDPDVELFLRQAKFPYSIGYGMTETAPLLAGAAPFQSAYRSTGPALEGVEIRLSEKNPRTGVGEIQVRGPNVMQGYYKNPEANSDVFTEDGWLKTGDLGCFDSNGQLTIRGRSKTVILGSSGENIYPEAIEAVINQVKFVSESLVLQRGKELVAKVVINYEALKDQMQDWAGKASDAQEVVKKYLIELRREVNAQVNGFSRIAEIEEQKAPFEKTPTLKIKRYLYAS